MKSINTYITDNIIDQIILQQMSFYESCKVKLIIPYQHTYFDVTFCIWLYNEEQPSNLWFTKGIINYNTGHTTSMCNGLPRWASFYPRPFSYKKHPSKLRFSYITKQISFLPKRQLETQFMSMVYKKKRDYIIITIT